MCKKKKKKILTLPNNVPLHSLNIFPNLSVTKDKIVQSRDLSSASNKGYKLLEIKKKKKKSLQNRQVGDLKWVPSDTNTSSQTPTQTEHLALPSLRAVYIYRGMDEKLRCANYRTR